MISQEAIKELVLRCYSEMRRYELYELTPIHEAQGLLIKTEGVSPKVHKGLVSGLLSAGLGRIDVVSRSANKKEIECDMSYDKAALYGQYDFVFNIAQLQNVYYQSEAYRNCHYFLRQCGVAIHVLPMIGGWYRDTIYLYDHRFIENLCKMNRYEILATHIKRLNRGRLLCAALLKTSDNVFGWTGECAGPVERNRRIEDF